MGAEPNAEPVLGTLANTYGGDEVSCAVAWLRRVWLSLTMA